jgi:hypothetical protein
MDLPLLLQAAVTTYNIFYGMTHKMGKHSKDNNVCAIENSNVETLVTLHSIFAKFIHYNNT